MFGNTIKSRIFAVSLKIRTTDRGGFPGTLKKQSNEDF